MSINLQREASNKKIKKGTIIYSINEGEKTAKIIGNDSSAGVIVIPQTITYESHEYTITSISNYAFQNTKIKTIQFAADSKLEMINNFAFWKSSIEYFTIPPHLTTICESSFARCQQLSTIEIPPDSELKTIKKLAFWNSSIESLSISSNLVNLEEDWCSGANNLNKISVNPNNPRYKSYDENKFIIGKKSIDSENHDSLVFCIRNIEKATIPNFIKEIQSHSFDRCINIQTIEISANSQLETIHKEAFYDSSIEYLKIPSSLINLKEGWCSGTNNLNFINIDPKNEKYSLFDEKLLIEKSSIESENYDVLVFCPRNATTVKIPNYIKKIGSYAFEMCQKLRRIEISLDSSLEIIEKYAFFNSSIENFTIPYHLKKICESAFSNCEKLRYANIPTNSELHTIGKNAFWISSIESLSIPSHLTKIDNSSFSWCYKLKIVEINENTEIECIDRGILGNFKQAIIMIPIKVNARLKFNDYEQKSLFNFL